MEPLVTYVGAVYPWQCDHVGHMNVMWYTGKFDEASWNMMARLGLTPRYLREGDRGMAAVQQVTRYQRELQPGDIVRIVSRLLELRDRSLRFEHTMLDGETDAVVAVTELTAVHLDKTMRRATPFPPEIRARAAALLAPDAPAPGQPSAHG